MDIRKALEEQAVKDGRKLITEGDRLFVQRLLQSIPDEKNKKREKKNKARRTWLSSKAGVIFIRRLIRYTFCGT